MLVCAEQDSSFDTFTNSETLLQAVLHNVWLREATTSFLKRDSDIDRRRKVVGVVQTESARVALLDEPDIVLSSNSATTCVIAVAVCRHSGYASVAHFDEGVATNANFVQWLRDMTHPDVYLVGDFALPTESGVRIHLSATESIVTCCSDQESISAKLLWFLHCHSAIRAALKLACVREANTMADGFPAAYALCFDCRRELAFPDFSHADDIPASIERHVGIWCRTERKLQDVYDEATHRLCIRGFRIDLTLNPSYYLKLSDAELLRQCSTSPDYEPPSFVKGKKLFFNRRFIHGVSTEVRGGWEWLADRLSDPSDRPDQWFEWRIGVGWCCVVDA